MYSNHHYIFILILFMLTFLIFLNIYDIYGTSDSINSFTIDKRTLAGKFNDPTNIVSGNDGSIYVLDRHNNRIQKFTNDGEYILDWKLSNSSYTDNQIQIAKNSADDLFFLGLNDYNYAIKKFSNNGDFLGGINYDTLDKYLNGSISSINVDSDNNIYLTSTESFTYNNYTLSKFSENFTFINSWKILPNFSGLFDMISDSKNNLYLLSYHNKTVLKYYNNGTFIGSWKTYNDTNSLESVNQVIRPISISLDSIDNIYVLTGWNQIMKYSSNGTKLAKFDLKDELDNNRQQQLSSLTIDPSGDFFTANIYSNRIQKFSNDGDFITSWGNNYNDQFFKIKNISKDLENNIYVADEWIANDSNSFNLIKKFSNNGTLIDSWKFPMYESYGKPTWPYSTFHTVQDMEIDKKGNIYLLFDYISDGNKLQKLSHNGILINSWGKSGNSKSDLQYPISLSLDNDGNVYILDSESIFGDKKGFLGVHQIKKFSNNGTFITSWGSTGDYHGQKIEPVTKIDAFTNPIALEIDNEENLLVLDKGDPFVKSNPLVLKFSNIGELISKSTIDIADEESFLIPLIMKGNNGQFYVYARDSSFMGNDDRILKFDSKGRNTEIIYIDGLKESSLIDKFLILPDSMILADIIYNNIYKIKK